MNVDYCLALAGSCHVPISPMALSHTFHLKMPSDHFCRRLLMAHSQQIKAALPKMAGSFPRLHPPRLILPNFVTDAISFGSPKSATTPSSASAVDQVSQKGYQCDSMLLQRAHRESPHVISAMMPRRGEYSISCHQNFKICSTVSQMF